RFVCDARPRGRDQVVEERPRDVLLVRREVAQRTLDVVLDDLLCAAEPLERRNTELVRPAAVLLVPEPPQHELQVRRLDSRVPVRALDRAATGLAEVALAGDDL